MHTYYVYILASRKDGVLYVGVTNNLVRRVWEHKQGFVSSFTKKYNVHNLVHFEVTSDIKSAIAREKQLKNWKREWKINLIEEENPEWRDLYIDITSDNTHTVIPDYVPESRRSTTSRRDPGASPG